MAICDNIHMGIVVNIKKKDALCIFINSPEHRLQNSWLQPDITPQQAVQFYSALIKDLIQDAHLSNSFDVLLFHPHQSNTDKIKSLLGRSFEMIALPDALKINQIHCAVQTAFVKKYSKVIVLCADVPDINHIFIQDAFKKLKEHDVIVGPTSSHDFYLLGMKKSDKKIFNISSDKPLHDLTQNLIKQKFSFKLLKELSMINSPVDLQQLWTRNSARPPAIASIQAYLYSLSATF